MKAKSDQVTRTAQQLLLIGGLLTLALAPILFLLQTPIADIQLSALTGEVIAILLAFILLFAARQVSESQLTAILLALVTSVALMAFGGTPGLVGGLFGLVGALVISVPYLQDFVTWKS